MVVFLVFTLHFNLVNLAILIIIPKYLVIFLNWLFVSDYDNKYLSKTKFKLAYCQNFMMFNN